jgi:hypothetical protein
MRFISLLSMTFAREKSRKNKQVVSIEIDVLIIAPSSFL